MNTFFLLRAWMRYHFGRRALGTPRFTSRTDGEWLAARLFILGGLLRR
jgi:hypothetical protein